MWSAFCITVYLTSSVFLESNFNCNITLMDYTTWTRDYNESKTTTSKIVTAVYDMLVIVYVRDNKILCNKMFDTVLNISSLNIYAKNVVEIEKHFLQRRDLEDRLEINHGNMKTIRRQTFVDLRIRLLLLESNNIMRIENEAFVNLSRLEQLNLSRNKLKELNWESFVGLPKLKTFFSSLNRISKLQKNAFQFLQSDNASIVLNGNVIETVEQEVFSELTIGIDTLDLSVNKIKILPAGVFKGSCFLKVDLSDNNIQHISSGVFEGLHVQNLDLTFNPLDNGTLVLLEIWASKKNVSLRYLPPPPHHHLLKRLRAGSNTRVFSSFDFIVKEIVVLFILAKMF
ncbi:hypothetical protein MTP99_007400 [Tenebrio molitor]|nr:hypothetical protein MTP99_007400 [Tenebrio molitor]